MPPTLRNLSIWCTLSLLAACWLAAPVAGAADQKADEEAIRHGAQQFVEAFHRRDARAIGALWTEDGDYVDETGQVYSGREAIVAEFERYFAGSKGRTLQVHVDAVRFITPDVAVVDGVSEVEPLPEGPPVRGRYSSVRVKRDGRWLVAAVRETAEPVPSSYEHLKELEWMLGEWLDEDENASVRTSVRWAKNKNFLVREFTVKMAGRPVLSGTQHVGWDPERKQIKSWVFDSEGGVAEGLWLRDGNRWVIRTTATLRDGERASSTNIITKTDDDTFTWRSTGRVVGDQSLPDEPEVKVVRLPPQPE